MPLPQTGWRWEIHNDPTTPKTVAAWRSALNADVVMNAAYFLEDYSPAGFLSADGVRSGMPWPNLEDQTDTHGYTFMVSVNNADELALRYLPDSPQATPAADSLLSFPTLLAGGTPLVEKDSGLYASRTILAEDANGNDVVIITEKETVTLYDMAQWLAAQPEHFVTAGNLDGGPSTGVSIENGIWDLEDVSAAVPSVIAGYKEE